MTLNFKHKTNYKQPVKQVLIFLFCLLTTLTPTLFAQTESGISDRQQIEQAALAQVAQFPELVPNDSQPFQVDTIRLEGRWAFLNLTSFPVHREKDSHGVFPDVLLAVAQKGEDGQWEVFLENMPAYREVLEELPNSLLSDESKSNLLSVTPSDSAPQTAYSIPGLPWLVGTSWRYNQGPHGGDQYAYDFGTPVQGVSTMVHAADSGTVTYRSQTCISIRRPSDNLTLTYQHIQDSDIANWSVGDSVSFGQQIGMTTISPGCNGSTSGHHVHFYFGGTVGSSMNGWVLQSNGHLIKNGVDVTPNQSDTILHSGSSCCGCLLAQPLANSQPLSEYEAWLAAQVEGEGRVRGGNPLGLDGLLLEGADEDVVMEDEVEEVEVVHEVADGDVVMGDEVVAMEEVVDRVAPTGSLMVDGGGEVVYSLNVMLNLAAEDAEGAVTGMRFSTDGQEWGAWEPYQARRLWQLENHGGQQVLYAQVRDAAGNVSEPLTTTVVAELNVDPPSSNSYTLARSALTMGGGQKTSTSYIVRGNSGQSHETGSLASSSYHVISGFWAGINAITPTPSPTPTAPSITPTPSPTPTPPPAGEVSLVLSPITVTTSISNTFEVDMIAQAGTAEVDGVSAYLNFNPAELRVLGMTLVTDFPIVLQNDFDNNTGEVDFAAGMLSEPYPSGTFTLATITFEAIGESDGSAIDFNMTTPRQSDMTFGGSSILEGTAGSTVMISNLATLKGCVTLQGRPSPPNSRLVVPLRVSLTVPGESVPAYTFEPTTDENGCFEVTGIALGTYQVRVKKSTTLQNLLEPPVTLTAGMNEVYLYTLLEGDANDDNIVNIRDFSILAASFAKCEGMPGFDPRADFNGDNCVTIQDFSLLASNFGKMGDIIVPPPTMMEGSLQPSEGVTMLIEPASTSVKPDEPFSVRVKLETGNQKVDGTQIILHFDPQLLQVEQLLAGETFPLELINEVDNRNGTISFAAGTLEAFPSGTLDVVELQLRALAPTEGTSLTFAADNPQSREANDTLSADVTFEGESVLGNYADGLVIVSQPTSVMLQELAAPATGIALWLIVPLGLIVLGGIWIMRRKQEG